jgi:hypothetical protein
MCVVDVIVLLFEALYYKAEGRGYESLGDYRIYSILHKNSIPEAQKPWNRVRL